MWESGGAPQKSALPITEFINLPYDDQVQPMITEPLPGSIRRLLSPCKSGEEKGLSKDGGKMFSVPQTILQIVGVSCSTGEVSAPIYSEYAGQLARYVNFSLQVTDGQETDDHSFSMIALLDSKTPLDSFFQKGDIVRVINFTRLVITKDMSLIFLQELDIFRSFKNKSLYRKIKCNNSF